TVARFGCFDDGTGPALYAGCSSTFSLTGSGGGLFKWTGANWIPVGNFSANRFLNTSVDALAIFDDGSGAALYAGGRFSAIGNLPTTNIARWNGKEWSA